MQIDLSASGRAEIAVFGPQAPAMFAVLRSVIRDLEHSPVRYEFLSVEDHGVLLRNDLAAGLRVQVTELLYHAHFVAVATLVRAYRWAEGCLAAYSQGLFLPFCASARGLLEAVGDSLDSLPGVPLSLATLRDELNSILAGEPQSALFNFSEIENVLLHFSHGRRLSRQEKDVLPDYAKAKDSRTYALLLETHGPGGFYAWYQELCELVHPAGNSVNYLLTRQEDGRLAFNPSIDTEHLTAHLAQHRVRLAELLRVAQVPALTMLRVLAHMNLPALRVGAVAELDMSNIQAWVKCADAMKVSH